MVIEISVIQLNRAEHCPIAISHASQCYTLPVLS